MISKGITIFRNVDIFLHKPLPESFHEISQKKLDEAGLLVDVRQIHNDVVDAGEIWIAELLAQKFTDDSAIASPINGGLQYIATGTSSVAVTQNDYKLGSHLFSKAATVSFNAGANNKFTVSVTFTTSESNGALTEAGIFAAVQTGTGASPTGAPTGETDKSNRMFNRTVFPVITKTTDFELTIQWTIEIGSLTA